MPGEPRQDEVMADINAGGARKGSGGVHRGGHALADYDLCKRRRRSEGTGTMLRWGRGKSAKRSEAQQGRMLGNKVLGKKGASQEERRVLHHGSKVPARAKGGGGDWQVANWWSLQTVPGCVTHASAGKKQGWD
ncbi:hypothetical protein B0H19DRAFT_1067277 [Mycena capillaripes]|nr:hypothetical protein B0H19DRAFT_1067277 [Mycena capillaripes]